MNQIEYIVQCPILKETMRDPVLTTNGQTYEKKAILEWFKYCKKNNTRLTDPISNEIINSDKLIPNHQLRKIINILFPYENNPIDINFMLSSSLASRKPENIFTDSLDTTLRNIMNII